MRKFIFGLTGLLSLLGGAAHAEICQYRLTELAGRVGSAMTAPGAAPAGMTLGAAGFQIVIQPPGGRASGALGLLGGVSGLMGSSGLMGTATTIAGSPVALFAAGSALVGTVGLQVGCHLRDERINDYYETLIILRRVAADMPPDLFELIEPASSRQIAFIRVQMEPEAPMREFDVSRLMIVNGRLVHRDFGPNTVIGDIAVFLPRPAPE